MAPAPEEFGKQYDLSQFDKLLVQLYLREATPVDALAYSELFARMAAEMRAAGDTRDIGDLYRRLLSMRKAGQLPRFDLRRSA